MALYTHRGDFRKSEDYPWIAWTFLNSRREVANMYDVSVPGDTSARNPKRWKVYGSNQGGSWVLLDEKKQHHVVGAVSNEAICYEQRGCVQRVQV